jgi:Leucine-rich repeat (LRR) protein
MQALDVSANKLTDLAPVAGLVKLASLYMAKNQIKDLKPLESTTRISTLDLAENQIEDLSPLAKQTELGILIIEKNQIKDLGPLVTAAKADAQGMKRWAPYLRLYLAGNPLSDAAKGEQLGALKAIGVRIEGT